MLVVPLVVLYAITVPVYPHQSLVDTLPTLIHTGIFDKSNSIFASSCRSVYSSQFSVVLIRLFSHLSNTSITL